MDTRRNTWGAVDALPRSSILEKLMLESFEICGAAGLGIYGFILMITQQTPPTLARSLPHWTILLWGLVLFCAGSATVYGMFRSKQAELAGLIMMGVATIAYSLVIIAVVGVPGLAASTYTFSFALASLLRALLIILSARTRRAIDYAASQ